MIDTATIEVIDKKILERVPPEFLEDGRLFLDGCGSTKATKNVNINIGDNINKPNVVAVNRLQMTPKNKAVLGYNVCESILTIFRYGGQTLERSMYVLEVNLESQTYQIKWNVADPLEIAKNTPICEVFGDSEIVYDTATVQQLITNDDYDGSGDLLDALALPFVYYGKFIDVDNLGGAVAPHNVYREDLRLFVHPYYIFQRFFNTLGYSFECPLYLTDFGKRNFRYLLGEDYWDFQGHSAGYFANTRLNVPVSYIIGQTPTNVPQDAITSSAGIPITPIIISGISSFRYTNPLSYTAKFEVSFSAIFFNSPSAIALNIIEVNGVLLYSSPFIASPTEISGNAIVTVPQGGFIDITIRITGGLAGVANFSDVAVNVNASPVQTYLGDDIIPLSGTIDCDKTVYDLIEAESHLFNFVISRDEQERKVRFGVPFDTDVYGEFLEGDIGKIRDAKKLSGNTCELDVLQCGQKSLLKRQYDFEFDGNNDIRVEQAEESGEVIKPTFGRLQTFTTLNTETKKYKNPLYSPTIVDQLPLYYATLPVVGIDQAAFSAWMASSTAENTFDQGYRAVILHHGIQIVNGVQSEVQFENVQLIDPLIAYQVLPDGITLSGGIYNLSFNTQDNNLYDIFYSSYFDTLKSSSVLRHKRTLTANEFINTDEFNYYLVEFAGQTLLVRIIDAMHENGRASFTFQVQ